MPGPAHLATSIFWPGLWADQPVHMSIGCASLHQDCVTTWATLLIPVGWHNRRLNQTLVLLDLISFVYMYYL